MITKQTRDWLVKNTALPEDHDEATAITYAKEAITRGKLTTIELAELQGKDSSPMDKVTHIRVKRPSERYSTTKTVAKHARSGESLTTFSGAVAEKPSQRECALIGAWLKDKARRSGKAGDITLTEHEKDLLTEIYSDDTVFVGPGGAGDSAKVTEYTGSHVKALIDDALSGGDEINPIWFDDALVTSPLLTGELFPFVDLVEVPRGGTVEGASLGVPTVVWNVADATAMTPFTTDNLVGEINTTLFPVTAAIEIGRDLIADTPVSNLGQRIVDNLGMRIGAELDDVIASGDGTTQPTGIDNDLVGSTDIGDPISGANGATIIDDWEALLFGLAKQYRNSAMRPAFIGNDTTYRRARALDVSASDARRLFGFDYQSYMLMQYPFRVATAMANTHVAFMAMKAYRLYRRMSSGVEFTNEGRDLRLRNLTLLTLRGRYGGQVVDQSGMVFSDSWTT